MKIWENTSNLQVGFKIGGGYSVSDRVVGVDFAYPLSNR